MQRHDVIIHVTQPVERYTVGGLRQGKFSQQRDARLAWYRTWVAIARFFTFYQDRPMFDTVLDPEDFLEKPADVRAHDAHLTTLRQRAAHTRAHAEAGTKELADHGRALGRLSEALGIAGECDEAIEAREEALDIWRRLQRKSAAHLATLKLAELHDRRGDTDRVNELLASALHAERQDVALERAYKLTRRHIEARMFARRGELASAHALLRVCLAELSGRSRTPLYIQLDALRARIEELAPQLLHK